MESIDSTTSNDNISEDFLDYEMPAGKAAKGQRSRSRDNGRTKIKNDRPAFRKAQRTASSAQRSDPTEDKRKHDEKLMKDLSDVIGEYSQQRMRALHMSFRLYGNDEMRMTYKEMMQSLNENGVSIPNLLLKPLVAKFDSSKGIDLEAMFKFLIEAHNHTGRDSVLAMHTRNDLAARSNVSQEEWDEDLLWRIESQLVRSHDYINLDHLRTELQKRDISNTGRLDMAMLNYVCQEAQLPIFGSLLKNLIKRCDDENNHKIRWPMFLSFLERGQKNAWEACPSLTSLPEQRAQKMPAVPTVLDELSVKARENIVNKFRNISQTSSTDRSSTIDGPTKMADSTKTSTANPNTSAENCPMSSAKCSSDKTPCKVPDNVFPTYNTQTDTDTFGGGSEQREGPVSKSQDTKAEVKSVPVEIHAQPKSIGKSEKKKLMKRSSEPNLQAIKARQGGKGCNSGNRKKSIKCDGFDKGKNKQGVEKVDIDIKIEEPSEAGTPIRTANDIASVDETLFGYEMTLPDDVITAMSALTDDTLDNGETDTLVKSHNAKHENNTNGIESAPAKSTDVDQDQQNDARINETGKTQNGTEGEKPSSVHGEVVTVQKDTNGADDKPMKTVTYNIKGTSITYLVPDEWEQGHRIDPPSERLKLQWVYGYRGNDCRKNIHILANGDVLYFVSYIAIMYNRPAHKQRHYKEHTDDIKCIDLHSDGIIVATGQYANRKNPDIKAHIRVWRSDNLNTLHVLGMGLFEKSIACVAFAHGQDLLAGVDNCADKKLTVWDTSTGELRGQDMLFTDLVCDMAFNPSCPDTLVTVGKEHTCWWKACPASCSLQQTYKPQYNNFMRAKFTICVAFNEKGDMATGDSNGTIYVFASGGYQITNYVKHGHDGPVFTVLYQNGFLLSGGRDGLIHCWMCNKNMDSAGFFQVQSEGGVRMLRMQQNRLLVGTTVNSLLEISTSNDYTPLHDAKLSEVPLTQCHYDDVRGIASVRHSDADIMTAGYDGMIIGFNTSKRVSTMKVQYKGCQFTCLDVTKDGSLMTMGTKDGHVHVVRNADVDRRETELERKLSKERIECIKITPDGHCIAAGSTDQCIYLVSYLEKSTGDFVWEFTGKLKGHTSPINGMDWSQEAVSDGYLLRSSSTALELKYWKPWMHEDCTHQVSQMNVTWNTHTVQSGVDVIGMIGANAHLDREVTSLNANGQLCGAGDNSGRISLFQHPCSNTAAFCHSYRCHTNVTGLCFTDKGTHVMTIGGRDTCLMQWEIT